MSFINSTRRRLLLVGCAIALFAGQAFAAAPAPAPHVMIETSMGNFTLELYPDKAPKTVANFLKYVEDKHYNGTIFHRVIESFMIQGGGMTPDMAEKPTRAPVQNEANNGLKNDRGTVAMARTNDPHSATSQFFINVVNNDFLNYKAPNPATWGYCVFGKVVDGMDVVDRIKAVKTGNIGPYQDVPATAVVIKSVHVVAAAKK
ncbi:peptidylprolyl isomerase [Uliginosibacterium gangwonense]|uniref:peptidylprolyl isomerase n=1 Tax=Uliginosibacterium gangwonense TaxID=392736 RepID=UPI0003778A3F